MNRLALLLLLLACANLPGGDAQIMPTGHDPNDPQEPAFMRAPLPDDLPAAPAPEMLPGYRAEDDHAPANPFDGHEPQRQMLIHKAFDKMGNADTERIRDALKSIASQSQLQQMIPDAQSAAPQDPLGSNGWRLWIFWAPDVPIPQVYNQIPAIRAEGIAVYQLPIISLRQWEAFARGNNERRDSILRRLNAAVASNDRFTAESVASEGGAWVAELQPLRLFMDQVAPHGIPLVPNISAANILLVRTLPSYRLISPQGRVHLLDGSAPGMDLHEFCRRAIAWEEAHADELSGKGM